MTQWSLIHREVWLGGRKRQHGWHEQQGTTIRGRGDNGRQHRMGTRAALESMGWQRRQGETAGLSPLHMDAVDAVTGANKEQHRLENKRHRKAAQLWQPPQNY